MISTLTAIRWIERYARSWSEAGRVHTHPAAAFQIITDKNQALRILSTMEIQQGTRMQRLGLNFVLNDETCALFYRNLVGGGVDSGYVVVSALRWARRCRDPAWDTHRFALPDGAHQQCR